MRKYREEVRRRISGLDEVSFKQVQRAKNERAYALARLASFRKTDLHATVCVEHLGIPSIERERIMEIEEGDCRIDPIQRFL